MLFFLYEKPDATLLMSFIQELGLETDDKTALSGLFSDYDTYELWLCFYQPYSYTIAMDYSN